MTARNNFGLSLIAFLLTFWVLPLASAQDGDNRPSWIAEPAVDRDLGRLLRETTPDTEQMPQGRAARFRLFRMTPGFLADPVGLDSGDDALGQEDSKELATPEDSRRLSLAAGLDNPFFDYRLPGDPGGVGYYKVHSLFQLFDTGTTSLTVGLQALSPAGLETGGLKDGPTVLTPAVGVFQELWFGTAIQGFVGKNIRAAPGWTNTLENDVHYGLAFQCPLATTGQGAQPNLHFFVQALGRYRWEADSPSRKTPLWDVMPGIHWKLGDTLWMSFGAARYSMFTCSWQF